MLSARSCSALVMNRLTPSMCQVPSGCSMARVRPAPTSEPASGSVSTMVAPHSRSMASWANRCCSGVPRSHRTRAIVCPLAYIQTAGLEPRTSSATAQQRPRRPVPPSSAGSERRYHSASMKARYDLRSDSGMRTELVCGSNTGGLRSASAKDSASGPAAIRSSSAEDAAGGFLVQVGVRGLASRSWRRSTSNRLNSMSRRLDL